MKAVSSKKPGNFLELLNEALGKICKKKRISPSTGPRYHQYIDLNAANGISYTYFPPKKKSFTAYVSPLREYTDVEFGRSLGDALHVLFDGVHFSNCLFSGAVHKIAFRGCTFDGCNFAGASRNIPEVRDAAFLSNIIFDRCIIRESQFDTQSIGDTEIYSSNMYRNTFEPNAAMGGLNIEQTEGIGTNINLHLGLDESDYPSLKYNSLKECESRCDEQYLSWEAISTFGRLPLFGASAATLILFPIIGFFLASFNEQVRRSRESLTAFPDGMDAEIRRIILSIDPLPIPSLMIWLFFETIILAFASSLYTFKCPTRIKEFSGEKWVNELGKSALNYLPLSWSNRKMRYFVASLYAVGAITVGTVLVIKLVNIGWFIVTHS